MKVKQTIKLLQLILIGVLLWSAAVASATSDATAKNPEQVVHHLQSSLIQAMRQGSQLSYQGRFDFLSPVITQSHDFDLIIKTILGATYWAQLTQEQQNLIMNTFRQLSVATYAGQFTHHEGEQFEIIEQRALPHDQILVRSQLVKSDGGIVNFDYVLQQSDGSQWRIVNILFDGVSDLAIKRREYRAILQRDSFTALVEMLKEKIALTRQNQ